MNRLTIILTLLLVSACAGQPVYTPTTVNIPIPVACDVEIPTEPVSNVEQLKPDATLLERVKAVVADLETRKAYDEQLVAALKACS